MTYVVRKRPDTFTVDEIPGVIFATQAEAQQAIVVVKLRNALIEVFGNVTIDKLADLIITVPAKGQRLRDILTQVYPPR